MPKKTRTQKMAAHRHKATNLPRYTFSEQPVVEPKQKEMVLSATPKPFATHDEETVYFKKDISKSILITAIIFLLEVGFYLNTQYGFLSITQFLHF